MEVIGFMAAVDKKKMVRLNFGLDESVKLGSGNIGEWEYWGVGIATIVWRLGRSGKVVSFLYSRLHQPSLQSLVLKWATKLVCRES